MKNKKSKNEKQKNFQSAKDQQFNNDDNQLEFQTENNLSKFENEDQNSESEDEQEEFKSKEDQQKYNLKKQQQKNQAKQHKHKQINTSNSLDESSNQLEFQTETNLDDIQLEEEKSINVFNQKVLQDQARKRLQTKNKEKQEKYKSLTTTPPKSKINNSTSVTLFDKITIFLILAFLFFISIYIIHKIYEESKSILEKQKPDTSIRYNYNSNKTLLQELTKPLEEGKNCPKNQYLYQSKCYSECPTKTLIFEDQCVSNCEYQIYKNTCVKQCEKHQKRFNKLCIDECPKYEDEDKKCLNECPNHMFLVENICVKQCPRYLSYSFNQKCVKDCPSTHYTNTQKKCLPKIEPKCPGGYTYNQATGKCEQF